MAVTKMMNIKQSAGGSSRHLKNAIDYILKPEKTDNGILVGGNSGSISTEVYQTMTDTKKDWGKLGGRQGYHFVISWKPEENVDRDTAYQILQEFCEQYLGDNYDYVFSVHTDQKHMHGHIIFNSVNRITGYKYHYKDGDWEKSIQPVTDKICERHNLQKLEYDRGNRKGKSYAEWNAEKDGRFSWKKIIRADIDYCISVSESWEDFLEQLQVLGYKIKTGHSNKKGKDYISLRSPGQERPWKNYSLGAGYDNDSIKARIGKNLYAGTDTFLPPRIKFCRMPQKKVYIISKYQLSKVGLVHVTKNYFLKRNPYRVNQYQVRKNLLQIEKLREDCVYLITHSLQSREDVEFRMQQLKKEEKEILNYMENHRALPFDVDEIGKRMESAESRLKELRQEKKIIRHIQKEDRQVYVTPVKKEKLKNTGKGGEKQWTEVKRLH